MDYSKKIHPGERILRIVRRSPWSLGWEILAGILLIAAPFLLMWSLFHLGTGGVIIFCYLIFLGMILELRAWLRWYYNFILITDQRTLIYRKYSSLEKEVLEIPHERVGDISFRIKGLVGNLVGYGQIKVEYMFHDELSKVYLKHLVRPHEIQNLLVKLRDQALKNLNKKPTAFLTPEMILKQATTEDLFEVIRQVKELLGEEKFYKTFFKK